MPQLRHYMVEFAIHGINKTWGLGFGEIIPYFVISDEVMDVIRNKDIVLYGAGNVGRSFHKFLEISRAANVVMWADKNPRLDNVCHPDDMSNIKYDFVLVAVQGRDLMRNIKDELVGMGVLPDLIIYGEPRTIIGTF
jgi:hypothetical protein